MTDPIQGEPRTPPWWLWPNVLSLDAPLVAAVWLWLFAACERMSFGWPTYVALTGVVWCVYTTDRLIDVWRVPAGSGVVSEPPRKRFARRHWRAMSVALLAAAAVTLWVILTRVPVIVVARGITVSALVWLYLAMSAGRRSPLAGAFLLALAVASYLGGLALRGTLPTWFIAVAGGLGVLVVAAAGRGGVFLRTAPVPRELLCGVAFAAGVALPVHVYNPGEWGNLFALPVAMFAGLCALNCLVIASSERLEDKVAEPAALPQRVPGIGDWVPALAVALVLLAGWSCWDGRAGDRPVVLAVAGGALGLLAVHRSAGRFGRAVPVLADLALIVPAPLFFPWR